MNANFIDKLTLIILRDKKVLFVRSKNNEVWYSPGGKREEGETDAEALMRELEEELSIQVKPETMTHYGTFEAQAHGKSDGVMVRIACYRAEYEGVLQPSAEIEELAWFSSEDKMRTTDTGALILEDLRKNNLID